MVIQRINYAMGYYNNMVFFLISVCFFAITSNSAVVDTQHGKIEGQVIVRQFDEITVVTIITDEKRLFQFYSHDVNSITSEEALLLNRNVELKENPSEDSALVVENLLQRGLEVIPTNEEKDGWIKIKIWADIEGWIPKDVLTNEIEFLAEPILPRTNLFPQTINIDLATEEITDATPEAVND